MSAVSWVKIDGFEKFKIILVRFDLTKEKIFKRYQFLFVFYDFEKLLNQLLLTNQNFLLFSCNCRVGWFYSIFWWLPGVCSWLYQIRPPPSFLTYNPVDKCWHNKHLDKKGLFTLSILIKTYPDLPKPYLKKLIRIISLFTVKKKKEWRSKDMQMR